MGTATELLQTARFTSALAGSSLAEWPKSSVTARCAWTRYKTEQVVTLLRQIEVAVGKRQTTPQACKEAENTP